MSKQLCLRDDDSQSNASFDSSQICSSVSRTASMDSQLSTSKRQLQFFTPSHKTKSIDQNSTQKTISIQKPRIFLRSQRIQNQFEKEVNFQLGFVMGKGKKNVFLNDSKVKKGKNFFDDQETTFGKEMFPSHSLFQFPQMRSLNSQQKNHSQEPQQLSMPCFRNMGKKEKVIQIDQNFLEKAKNFFNDEFQDTSFLQSFSKSSTDDQVKLMSFRKPTKVKKTASDSNKSQQNFIKTVNVNKKQKRLFQTTKNLENKKQVFDWNKFLISSKKLFYSEESSCQKKSFSKKKSTQKKKHSSSKSKYGSNKSKGNNNNMNKISFDIIKLDDLPLERFQERLAIQKFTQQKDRKFQETIFNHNLSLCVIPKCLLCNLKINKDLLDCNTLEQIFSQKLSLEKLDHSKFTQLYSQIVFKLMKYSTFYPQIINKNLNPSNILVEMHKKSKQISLGLPSLGWIDYCLKENKFYNSFLAQIRQIYHNEKIKMYFILLSDGWTNVWAIVTEKNYMYQFIGRKLRVCMKIFLGYWKIYSLANILSFCPKAKQGQKCIEIYYNSCILVNENVKLGKPKKLIFYRPLNLNRKEGGIIPTVEGTILRMFCPSHPSKQKSYSTSSQVLMSFSQNYIEIMTPEGYTTFIKFILSSQSSLAQIFRLYYKYQFYFLKISQKDNFLQFVDDFSKCYEFPKKNKNLYEDELVNVIKRRFVNSAMNAKNVRDGLLKVGGLYDVRLEGLQGVVNGCRFFIENNNCNGVNSNDATNSFLKVNTLLYQQYQLDHIEKLKNPKQVGQTYDYYLKKTTFSSTLKALPQIYEKVCS